MVKATGSLTQGPTLDTSDPKGTLKDAFSYVIGVGFMIVLLAVGSNVAAPLFGSILSAVGIDTGDANGGVTMEFGA